MDLVEEIEKRPIYHTNPPGPIGMLQIFINNPSRGLRVRAETSGSGK